MVKVNFAFAGLTSPPVLDEVTLVSDEAILSLEPVDSPVPPPLVAQDPSSNADARMNSFPCFIAFPPLNIGKFRSRRKIFNNFFADSISKADIEKAQAMAFCVFSMSELFHMLGMTNFRKSFVHVFKGRNYLLWGSIVIGLALQFFVIYTPRVNDIFQVVPLAGYDFALILGSPR